MKIPDTVEEARQAMGLPEIGPEDIESPPPAASELGKPQTGRTLIGFGMFVGALLPIIAGIGMALMHLMPDCTGGSGGPASGCMLYGLNLNWFIQLSIAALVGAFLTVPIGVLIVIFGAIVCCFEDSPKKQ